MSGTNVWINNEIGIWINLIILNSSGRTCQSLYTRLYYTLSYESRLVSNQKNYVVITREFSRNYEKKYASFGHSAYFPNYYIRLSHLRAKYGKSPPKILSISTARQHKFSPNVWFSPNISALWKLQDDTFLLICALYWYIAALACWWRHVYGVQLPFWDAKEIRFRNLLVTRSFLVIIR